MKKTAKLQETMANPFEMNCDSKELMKNLATIDKRSIRTSFKSTKDPINLAFETIENTSLKTLAIDFFREGFCDLISYVGDFCKK